MVGIDRRRDGDYMKFRILQCALVGGKSDGRFSDSLVTDLLCRVDARTVKLNLCSIEVKADNIKTFGCKRKCYRHSDIAESDKRELFFSVYYIIVQRHI